MVFHADLYQCRYTLAAKTHHALLLAALLCRTWFSVFLFSDKTSVEQIFTKNAVLLEKA